MKNQPDEQDERDASALNEPLPECTLAFTYGIGKKVANKYTILTGKPLLCDYRILYFPNEF